jgi:hypothetical protein
MPINLRVVLGAKGFFRDYFIRINHRGFIETADQTKAIGKRIDFFSLGTDRQVGKKTRVSKTVKTLKGRASEIVEMRVLASENTDGRH